jgi:hypothetical protein
MITMDLKVIGIFAALALGSKLVFDRITPAEAPEETEETVEMEAHVQPIREGQITREWGSIPLVSTERGLMGGQAVGQNVNYTYPVGQQSGDAVNQSWTAYSYSLMTTSPTYGQNYFGRAMGSN